MIFVALCLIVLSSPVFSLDPSIKVAISSQMIDFIKDVVVHELSNSLTDITLPDIEKDLSVVKIKVTDIKIHIKPLNPALFKVDLIPNSSELNIKASGIGVNGSMDVSAKVVFVNYNCKGYLTISDGGFELRVGVIQNGTHLAIAMKSVKINLDKNSINVEIKGGVVASIMSVIANFLRGFFLDSLKETMTNKVPHIVTDVTNKLLAKLPDDVVLGQGIAVRFLFTAAPSVYSGHLVAPLLVYMHKEGQIDPPPMKPPTLPNVDEKCKSGLQLFFSDYIVQTAMNTMHELGKLKLRKNTTALGYDIDTDCSTNKSPEIVFNGDMSASIEAKCTADFTVQQTGKKFQIGLITSLAGALKEEVKDSAVYFSLARLLVNSVKITSGDEIDETTLLTILKLIIDEFMIYINEGIGKKGIPLPVFSRFELGPVEQSVVSHYLALCTSFRQRPGVSVLDD